MGSTETKTDKDKIRINFWISTEAHQAVNALGELDKRTMSDVIREALRDYIVKHSSRLNEGLKNGTS